MSHRNRWLFIIVVIVSLTGTLVTFIMNRNAPPVSSLKIPQSTLDFFKRISGHGHAKYKQVDTIKPKDYDNNSDYSKGLIKIEDDNFIVYFHDIESERTRAVQTLEYANNAIPELEKFFGKYYFPREVNNRKLAFYLAIDKDDFEQISFAIGGSTVDWAAGLTFNSFSSNGEKICKGIILNAMVQEGGSTDLKKVVFHEIAHYNHWHCMDLINKSKFMNWELEGLASYFANDWNKIIPPNTIIRNYSLFRNPDNYLDCYWMGYHAFDLANEMGKLESVVQNSFKNSLENAIPTCAECSMSTFDDKWRSHCELEKNNR